jgi:hypothetical protein
LTSAKGPDKAGHMTAHGSLAGMALLVGEETAECYTAKPGIFVLLFGVGERGETPASQVFSHRIS